MLGDCFLQDKSKALFASVKGSGWETVSFPFEKGLHPRKWGPPAIPEKKNLRTHLFLGSSSWFSEDNDFFGGGRGGNC